jgi:hypothetical protein
VRCETERAVVDFDPDGLDVAEREAFTRLADRGVGDLQRLILQGSAAPEPVRFIVSARVGMSVTFGRTVRLPLQRVKWRQAPYLHEAVHALLPTLHRSTWLSEGLACYLESWVAENVGGYDAQVFSKAGDRRIHDAARGYLESDLGRQVLPWVGVPGQPPDLWKDRVGVARPFYVLAHSFTKYLVEHLGLAAVVELAGGSDPEGALARLTGRDAGAWRAEWLTSRGLPRPVTHQAPTDGQGRRSAPPEAGKWAFRSRALAALAGRHVPQRFLDVPTAAGPRGPAAARALDLMAHGRQRALATLSSASLAIRSSAEVAGFTALSMAATFPSLSM